ncbi:MAG: FtsX-like permease family protein [Bacteroidota bacterium]
MALVAGVNYVNLMTAQSMQRAREVGVRKALGSDRRALRTQFLAEAVVTTLAAFVLSLVLIGVALEPFNLLVEKALTLSDLFTPLLMLSSVGLVVGGGVLAGLYPAFVLSSHRPVDVLKGQFVRSQEGQRVRKGLVVAQFTLSAVLMLGTLLVLNQRQHMAAQPLGFDQEQIIVVDAFRTPSQARLRQYETVKADLLTSPAVEAASVAQTMPGRAGWRGQIVQPEGRALADGLAVEYIPTDHDIVATLGLDIIAGRTFDRAYLTDADDAVIVNETAVRTFGWESPEKAVGKYLDSPSGHPRGRVIGVIRDFHQHGLQNSIAPVVFGVAPQYQRFVLVRVRPEQIQPALAQIEETWTSFYPGYPLQTSFLDDRFAEQYEQEAQLTRVFGTVGVLALLIACLGLFGLATFSAARRTKEIGVRKTLGASTVSLVQLLTRDVVVLVSIALAVAFPIAYFGMVQWLESYAYAAPISPTSFAVVAAVLLGVAIATVSYRAFRAAMANPIESLRHE